MIYASRKEAFTGISKTARNCRNSCCANGKRNFHKLSRRRKAADVVRQCSLFFVMWWIRCRLAKKGCPRPMRRYLRGHRCHRRWRGECDLAEILYLVWLGFVARGKRVPGSRKRFPQIARTMLKLVAPEKTRARVRPVRKI